MPVQARTHRRAGPSKECDPAFVSPAGTASRLGCRSSVARKAHSTASASAFDRIRDGRCQQSGSGISRPLLPAPGAEDAGVDSFVDGVTGAGRAFEPSYIDNEDIAAAISDQLPALQGGCRAGYAHAANTQHQCEEFMREVKAA